MGRTSTNSITTAMPRVALHKPQRGLSPDLLHRIFTEIPRHPYVKRDAALAALCLANRLFLRIARPLLYGDIRFDLDRTLWLTGSPFFRSFDTLMESKACADLVKSIRVRHRTADRSKLIAFAYLLSRLENVESVEPDRPRQPADSGFADDFLSSVARHCSKLRRLVLPEEACPSSQHGIALLSGAPLLENFEGHLLLPSSKNPSEAAPLLSPSFKRLVLRSSFPASTLTRLISGSFDTLTTLSFRMDGFLKPVDLSPLRHLSSLHIAYYPDIFVPEDEDDWNEDGHQGVFWLDNTKERTRLRTILSSARTLPIKEFLLTVRLGHPQPRIMGPIKGVDAMTFSARDPSFLRSEFQRLPIVPFTRASASSHFSDFDRESKHLIEKGGLKAIRVVEKFGLNLGLSYMTTLGPFVGEKKEVSEAEGKESDSEDEPAQVTVPTYTYNQIMISGPDQIQRKGVIAQCPPSGSTSESTPPHLHVSLPTTAPATSRSRVRTRLALMSESARHDQAEPSRQTQILPSSSRHMPSHSSRPPLPAQVLSNIFTSIPRHPTRQRNATLAALCCVNRLFLRIARPLLYRDFRLEWGQRYWSGKNTDPRLGVEALASLVKTVRLGRTRTRFRPTTTLKHVLSVLRNVESIRQVKDQHEVDPKIVSDFFEVVARYCPEIRHLEIPPHQDLNPRALDILFSSFPNLASLRGHITLDPYATPPEKPQTPIFELERLVLFSPLDSANLFRLVEATYDTLTVLAFHVDSYTHDFDLSRLHNLASLHITHCRTDYSLPGAVTNPQECQRLRKILETIDDLPLSDFALSLVIPSGKLLDDLQGNLGYNDFDTLAFWSDDDRYPRPESRHSPFPLPLSDHNMYYPWEPIYEASDFIEDAVGLDKVLVARENGIRTAISCSGKYNTFDDQYEGDSQSDRASDDDSEDEPDSSY
ncbi:hypothetical protein JCM16303_006314 [Sporobolomyces ruberrimus]